MAAKAYTMDQLISELFEKHKDDILDAIKLACEAESLTHDKWSSRDMSTVKYPGVSLEYSLGSVSILPYGDFSYKKRTREYSGIHDSDVFMHLKVDVSRYTIATLTFEVLGPMFAERKPHEFFILRYTDLQRKDDEAFALVSSRVALISNMLRESAEGRERRPQNLTPEELVLIPPELWPI